MNLVIILIHKMILFYLETKPEPLYHTAILKLKTNGKEIKNPVKYKYICQNFDSLKSAVIDDKKKLKLMLSIKRVSSISPNRS